MDAVGAMMNYPLGGRKVRPGEGRRHRSCARLLTLHIGPKTSSHGEVASPAWSGCVYRERDNGV